jgi:hypothetical protein
MIGYSKKAGFKYILFKRNICFSWNQSDRVIMSITDILIL